MNICAYIENGIKDRLSGSPNFGDVRVKENPSTICVNGYLKNNNAFGYHNELFSINDSYDYIIDTFVNGWNRDDNEESIRKFNYFIGDGITWGF